MKFKFILFYLFLNGIVSAQETDAIQTDRPDQTETPAVTPLKMLQIETGFNFEKTNNVTSSLLIPNILWKYGISRNLEIRLLTEFSLNKEYSEKSSGISPIVMGFKYKLLEENGIIPKTSFIGHLGLPNWNSSKFKLNNLAAQFRFTMQHNVTEKISISYNLGSEWEDFNSDPPFVYTLSTGYSISKKLGSYIEIFGFAPQNQKSSHNFDGGFTYLLSNNAMVDVSGGIGLTENAPKYYYAFGFSFRI